ncbi:MAG: hypothetical protein AAGK28_09255, partial [Pseudomonadota bacterium]
TTPEDPVIETQTALPQADRRAVLPALILAAIILLIALMAIELASSFGTKATRILKDPATVYKIPIFSGFVSHVGVFVLIATSAVAGFVSALKVPHAKRLA